MAPINKKIRAITRKNSDGSASANNSTTCSTPTTVTTTASTASNHTTVITTASGSSSAAQGAKTSGSNNAGSSESDQADGSSSTPGTPQSDDPNGNVVMGENCPNLSFVGRPKRSTVSIPTPSSVTSQYGKLLHSSSQRRENRCNVNINHQYIVPSPASSPVDPQPRPFSYSASSSSSSLSPSPSTSTSTQDKFGRSSDSPSDIYLYENGTRRRSVISSGDRSSPNAYKKGTIDESSVEHHHDFSRHSQYKHDTKTPDGSSSSSQSGKITIDKTSEEYRLRRERNNIAVRKSRSKSKIKFVQTLERMGQLETENAKLHHHIAKMNQELHVLKYLLEKYQDDSYKRMLKLDNADSMDIPPEIRMIDRVEIGDRFQIRNFGNSRSNINPFYSER
ncbi:uncharacterized protein DDB_G0271670 [Tetranychus urticae]|uniref:BZIP domain-containing protein n=1 Tax=Tetranychus urticae TaxID=32264 RepID=T1K7G9_TETUR|nr:uncharacterized protein DDB_G0271670 [Tetranychus urticae]